MNELSNIIAFYKACYQSDNRDWSISNYFSTKIENKIVLEQADLLEGKLSYYPMSTPWAEEATKNLSLYAKEKDLFCCSFFLIGQALIAGKTQKIVAPLLIHPVQLEKKDGVFYAQKTGAAQLNTAFVHALKSSITQTQGLYDELYQALPKEDIRFEECHQIQETLKKYFPSLDLTLLEDYPALLNQKAWKKVIKEHQNPTSLAVVPALALGVLKKSFFSRGVLMELGELAQEKHFSTPLKAIFTKKTNSKQAIKKEFPYVAANLSAAQENILQSAKSNTTSLVIGPPGTGKSFTIAAIAIDAFNKGESVLIASKNNEAVDVIGNKIEQQVATSDILVRGGRQDYKKQLKQRIDAILNGIGLPSSEKKAASATRKKLYNTLKKLRTLEQKAQRLEQKEGQRGHFFVDYQASFIKNIRHFFIKKTMQRELPFWAVWKEWTRYKKLKNDLVHQYSQERAAVRLQAALKHDRQSFKNLSKAISARTSSRKETLFDSTNFATLFAAVPIWLVNATDAYNLLPLKKELFDLVIIDEASQCDIASSLPLLYRAKRAIIVGDPKQLRHISFLSFSRQDYWRQQFEFKQTSKDLLNYRELSLLDIVAESIQEQSQVHYLDEHYRSMPSIIAFSNQQFYQNSLRIMTASPQNGTTKALFLELCEGKRSNVGSNKIEAAAIIAKIQQIITKEQHLEARYCQSIGILSPFREQVNLLRDYIEKELSLEVLQRHRILLGTPFSFQGEERDSMFLSFAVDADTHPSTFQYLERSDVFNVSITRARSQQYVYISIPPKQLKKHYLLAQYIAFIQDQIRPTTMPVQNSLDDIFCQEVIAVLQDISVEEIYTDYLLVGVSIDILLIYKGKMYAIDLIGYPGKYEAAFPIVRYKMLQRIGVHAFALPYSRWVLEQKRCVEALKDFITVGIKD